MGVVYWSPLCTTIGVLNLLVFLAEFLSPGAAFWPRLDFPASGAEPHQFITSLFKHANWVHLTSNAFFLFAFGCGLEKKIGILRFLAVYLVSGVGGCFLFSLFSQGGTMVGASGAIFGIICSMAFLDPKAFVVVPGMPLPVPIVIFSIAYLLQEYVMMGSMMIGSGDKIAHLAHIGGGLAGGALGRALHRERAGGGAAG